MLTFFLGAGFAPILSSAQAVNVTTWHNDNGRTGQNINETTLTVNSVTTNFGKLCSYPLNEKVYAQPLVLASIMIHGVLHEAVYVVTTKDNIYVFDGANYNGTSCIVLQGPFSLIPSNESAPECSAISDCSAVSGPVGILGTPAIDPSTNTLYVVTESQSNSQPVSYYHRLHELLTVVPAGNQNVGKLSGWKMASAVFMLCAATAIALPAQTFTKLHSFKGTDGANPEPA